ncbi:MAG: hypothetical protein NTU77_03785 [Actinobacteria bacterium]|nr:hypothetical protein [Actinomycetota bacterium]
MRTTLNSEDSLRVVYQSSPVTEGLPPLFVSRQAPGLVVDIDLSDNSAVRDYLDSAVGVSAAT